MNSILHGLHCAVWLFWLLVLAASGADLGLHGLHPQLGLVAVSSSEGARVSQFVLEIFSVIAAASLLLALALRLSFARKLAWFLGLLLLLIAAFAVLAGMVIGLPRAPIISFAVLLSLAGLLTVWASHWRLKPPLFTANSAPADQTPNTPPP